MCVSFKRINIGVLCATLNLHFKQLAYMNRDKSDRWASIQFAGMSTCHGDHDVWENSPHTLGEEPAAIVPL